MNLQHTPCSYHPNKVAVAVCERCRRPICLEDKRIYRRRHSSGSGNYRRSRYTSHEFCVLCNTAKLSSDAKWSPLSLVCIFPFILIFVFAFIPLFTISDIGGDFGFFGIFPLFFIGIFVFMILIIFGTVSQTKKKSQQAEIEASTFRDSLNNPSSPYTFQRYTGDGFDSPRQSDAFSSNSIPYSKSFSLVCYECGSNITIDDKFCSNCGDSTKQEIEKHYSKY
ncbi:MAG: hypothetical protein ACW981_14670 [Candidatus Hodarchaeales archaeon]